MSSVNTLLFNIVFLPEPFDAAGGVDEFLLAGEEGVAGGTNFYLDVLERGTGFNYIPAGAGNGGRLVFGVYLLFHFFPYP
jgi:hypothetical protein